MTYVLCISLNEGHSRLVTADECSIVAPCTENNKEVIQLSGCVGKADIILKYKSSSNQTPPARLFINCV